MIKPSPPETRPPALNGNPGSFQGRKLPAPRQFIHSFLKYLSQGRIKTAFYYWISHGCNYLQKWLRPLLPDNFYCPCCLQKSPAFIHLSNHKGITWNSACPRCDSRSRHRGMVLLLDKLCVDLPESSKFLHFAPEPVLTNCVRKYPQIQYRTSDLFLKNVDYPGQDITDLKINDHAFNFILCNHVLEHVENDQKAIDELHRILSDKGTAWITVPGNFKKRETTEYIQPDPNGHFRHYGLDFSEKLKRVFSFVEILNLRDWDPQNTCAIKPLEIVFSCTK